MPPLTPIIIVALIAGLAYAWHKAAERTAEHRRTEQRCRDERTRQENVHQLMLSRR